jgi:hypothetical protein
MKFTAAALGMALLMAAPSARAGTPVDLELVLAIDVSGSIDWQEAQLQRQGYIDALRSEPVVAAIRSGAIGKIAIIYVEWAGTYLQKTVIDWTVIDSADSANALGAELSEAPIQTGPWTSISSAIRYIVPLFDKNDFDGVRKVIDISGDGPNNAGAPVTEARQEALNAGITINGLPIINDRPGPGGARAIRDLDRYYKECVVGGPGAFMEVATSFDDFARAIQRKLVFEISDLRPGGKQEFDGPVPVQGVAPYCGLGERDLREQFYRRDF